MKKVKGYTHLLFFGLYLAVHFLPELGGADPMGFQWMYVSILDLFITGYILFNYPIYKEAIRGIFKSKFALGFGIYVMWALGSYFYAINPTEALVCLARLVSTFFIFMNLSVLLYKKDIVLLFKQLAFLVALFSLIDSISLTIEFFWQLGTKPFDNIVLSLRGISYGNKNIRAASVLINVPFILFYIIQSKRSGKIFGALTLCFTLFALFILNTRSTFVGLILIFSIYTAAAIFMHYKESRKWIIIKLAYFIVPILFAFLISNLVINHALKLQKGGGGYGTVTKRIGDITIEKGSDRLAFWKTGIDYSKKHLLKGAGYGNWKIASLYYEKGQTNDFVVRYHLHNDFLENFAELGIVGGILFLSIFLFAFLFTLKIMLNKKYTPFQVPATISFMAMTCYLVDAALNFPAERTVMQVMFAITAALLISPHSVWNEASTNEASADTEMSTSTSTETLTEASTENLPPSNTLHNKLEKTAIVLLVTLLVGSTIVNALGYKSMRFQKYMMGDLSAVPVMSVDQVKGLPSIPNLSFNTMPLPALLARYYIKNNRLDEAFKLLNADKNNNPYLHYNDYVMSLYYAAKENKDSTFYFAKAAFYNWPTANVYYYNLIPAAIKVKDTAEMAKAFNKYVQTRNEPGAWDVYLNARLELMGRSNRFSVQLADSAIKLFPNDSARLTNLRNKFKPKLRFKKKRR